MPHIEPINQLCDNLNRVEQLRNNNETNRRFSQRKNNVKTAIKTIAVSAAVPFSAASVVLSGIEADNIQVTYKIPKLFQKSETLKKIGYKIDEGLYKALDKTASLLKKPKAKKFIEQTDSFVDNISTKIFKKENELKYLHGGMTALGIKVLGTALLAGIALKHIVNGHKINKEYKTNKQILQKMQYDAIDKFNSDMKNI